MSGSEDSGPGRREVAHRLFAAEFDDADFSYSESDEERAPNYVVTPTGARVNRLFAVGVLTELEQVNEEVLRARIVDPTGPFVVYAGQYQPEALAFLEKATPPLFVAVTGKARTFEPEDSDRVFTSIRPESISEVDAETRDRWIVQAAEQTVERVARMASAKQSGLAGEALQTALTDAGVEESDAAGVTLALDHYGTTGDYLQAVRKLSLDAARVVADERDEAGTLSLSPSEGGDEPLASLAEMALTAPEPAVADTTASTPTAESEPEETATDEVEPEQTADRATEPEDVRDASETVEATTDSPGSDDSDPATESIGDFDAGDSGDESARVEDTGSVAETSEPAADRSSAETTDDIEEFDPEFELDEDEREEIESEYGTDFQSGSEVDEPGEAGIETPDPEELAEQEAAAAETSESGDAQTATESGDTADQTADATADDPAAAETGSAAVDASTEASSAEEPTAEGSSADEPTADESSADEPTADESTADDVDLEDAVMDAMTELNDGSGADRDAVRESVIEEYGADPDAVNDAIQDALMGGRCYEPEDGKLTPI